jgi:hypothetical protein
MPYSVVDKPSKYFDTQLFTGTNTSGRTFTGLNFQPDMIWGKQRDSANYNHFIVDVVRGGTKFIATNTTASEDTASHGQITSWNSDGTTWSDGTNGTYPRLYYNDNGQLGGSGTRVWWQWKANGAGVSNTAGTISSTVSANQIAGFSIVSYTGTGANATVGHGLGVAPSMIIIKNRNTVTNWFVYHSKLTSATYYLNLNSTSGQQSASIVWNSTAPTSSVFSLGSADSNTSSSPMIAYCFAEVKGFSKFGSYTGNNSLNNFVYTGFKPAFVMIKVTSTTEQWCIKDNKRNTYNVLDRQLFANASNAEDYNTTNHLIDFVSNGFNLKDNTSQNLTNGSGQTYIYMAFAESPFVSSKGLPTTAR